LSIPANNYLPKQGRLQKWRGNGKAETSEKFTKTRSHADRKKYLTAEMAETFERRNEEKLTTEDTEFTE